MYIFVLTHYGTGTIRVFSWGESGFDLIKISRMSRINIHSASEEGQGVGLISILNVTCYLSNSAIKRYRTHFH